MNSNRRLNSIVKFAALVLILTAPAWCYELLWGDPAPDQAVTATILAITPLILLSFAAAWFMSAGQRFLRLVMLVALLGKIAACGAYLYVIFNVYNGGADALRYTDTARNVADLFSTTGHFRIYYPVWSNNFVFLLTGGLFVVLGASVTVAMMVYALLSYWGQYLLYRSFVLAFPEADPALPAVLIFLMPSVLFWSSAVGKDALTLLFLGATMFGFAALMAGLVRRGVAGLAIGIAGTFLTRPHVGGILVIALVVPFLSMRLRGRGKGWLVKSVLVPLLLVTTFFIAAQAQKFVVMDDVSQAGRVIDRVSSNVHYGSSAMSGSSSTLGRVLLSPFLFFRPFPWEAHNGPAVLAAVEGLLLMTVCWRQRKRLRILLRGVRENTFTFFLAVFIAQFAVIFSAAITNFGLLARERVMALPMFLMVLCIPVTRTQRAAVARDVQWQTQWPEPEYLVSSK